MQLATPGLRRAAAVLLSLACAAGLHAQGSAATASPGEWMEVTQGVQDEQKPIPLVGGRTTWVRVYPLVHPERAAVLRGRLRVQWAGGVDTLPSVGGAHLGVPSEGKAPPRTRWTSSLNFLLPPHATQPGTAWLELVEVNDAETGARLRCPRCGASATAAVFGPPRVLRAKVIGFHPLNWPHPPPREEDFASLRSWLWRAYPVTKVEMETAMMDAPAVTPDCDAINGQLARIRALDVRGGQDPRTRYYGMVGHSEGKGKPNRMQGCSLGVPGVPDPSVVASGPAGIPPAKDTLFSWDDDGSYADWYGGHELAHTFGLRHPGWCPPLQVRDDPFAAPQDSGRIGGRLEHTVALDPLRAQVLSRDQWHDVMTYCARQWVGGRSYRAILRRLAEEDSLYAADSWPQVRNGGVSGGEDSLLQVVVRFSNVDSNAGRIMAVVPVPVPGRPTRLDSVVLDTLPQGLRVTVEIAGTRDTVRAEGWIALNRLVPGGGPAPAARSGFVNAFVRNVPGAARIRVFRGDRFVDQVHKTAHAPRRAQPVNHTLPQPGPAAGHRFTWRLTDRDGAPATPTAYVQVTYDGGARWHTVQQTWSEAYQFSCAALAHRASAHIRILGSDGVNVAVVYESGELVAPCRSAGGA